MPISTVPAFRALDAYRNEFQASQCCCGGLDSSLRSSLRTPQEYFIFLERITAKKNGRPRFSTFAPLTALHHGHKPPTPVWGTPACGRQVSVSQTFLHGVLF